jgi:hypothetical protein
MQVVIVLTANPSGAAERCHAGKAWDSGRVYAAPAASPPRPCEEAGENAAVCRDNRVLGVEHVKRRRSIIGIDNDLDAVPHVIDGIAVETIMARIRITEIVNASNLFTFSRSDFLKVCTTEFRLKFKGHIQCTVSDRIYEFNDAVLRDNLSRIIESHGSIEFNSLLVVENKIGRPVKLYGSFVRPASSVFISADGLKEINLLREVPMFFLQGRSHRTT